MKEIVIFGAGYMAQEVTWIIDDINAINEQYAFLGYIDANANNLGKYVYGEYKIIGSDYDVDGIANNHEVYGVIALQEESKRKQIYEKFKDLIKWETIIHPSAKISHTATIMQGSIVSAGVVVSNDAIVGKNCYLNFNSVVGHNNEIGNFVSVMSGAVLCGNVSVGECSLIGTNSSVIPGIRVGSYSKLGVGSALIENLEDYTLAVGNPAQKIMRLRKK